MRVAYNLPLRVSGFESQHLSIEVDRLPKRVVCDQGAVCYLSKNGKLPSVKVYLLLPAFGSSPSPGAVAW